jgi:PmbA protein
VPDLAAPTTVEPEELCPRLLRRALAQGGVDEAEAYVSRNVMTIARLETLRHGKRVIGPNAQQLATFTNTEACVRLVVKGAVGTAATIHLDERSLRNVVKDARAVARLMSPDPNFRSLAKPQGRRPKRLGPDKTILEGGASEPLLAQANAAVCCFPKGMDLAGSIIAVSEVFSVGNSNGVDTGRAEDTFAVAQLTAERVEGGDVLSSGMGWSASRYLSGLDAASAARSALELAVLEPKLKTVPEGDYDVILGPYSVADVIDNMLAPQMGLAQIYSGTSWLPAESTADEKGTTLRRPKLGESIAGSAITLKEEPHLEGAMCSRTFDDEGVPTAPRTLIERGVWKGAFSNSYYAHLYGFEPPGNGFRFGPRPGRMASAPISNSPTNLVLQPGDMSFDELIGECRGDALYVPRTWYTYPTRYGASGFSSSNRSTAFLIRKGELVPVAPNAFKLRGDAARVLCEVRGIGREASTATTWSASFCSIVPHLLTGGIRVEKPAE